MPFADTISPTCVLCSQMSSCSLLTNYMPFLHHHPQAKELMQHPSSIFSLKHHFEMLRVCTDVVVVGGCVEQVAI
jgi:hypothetical protein